jgi:hypothetical protein
MKNKISIALLKFTSRVIHWIIRSSKPELSGLAHLIDALILKLAKIYHSRGRAGFINYIKLVRLTWLNYLSGTPKRLGINSTTDGIPMIFGDLIRIIRKGESPALLQILNTLLFCTRSLTESGPLGQVDISSITGPPIKEFPSDIAKHIPTF